MRIWVGSDHAAIALRQAIVRHLRSGGHSVDEVGPQAGERSDYPDAAEAVARAVAEGRADRGVLVCGTGIGVSIAANKVPGIRAALVHDPVTARLAAEHNDAQVLCMGGRLLALEYAVDLVDVWLQTAFEARHQARLDKITALEAGS
ncbi:MAG: ribose 5-phosphate isomerase B [Deltaproteobacteria bacterium]|nr:ribose 5-phosphate isomerase B [Deltaproteobacteria bacterium]MCB9785797.1 ribose 5-phosphate isomerase B [Deltaproteobacteria bacterium]